MKHRARPILNYSLKPGYRDFTIAYLITGAAGFIGSNLVRHLLEERPHINLVALDALTYSGHRASLQNVLDDPRLRFVHGDIRDPETVRRVFDTSEITGVFHLAAESHVDRAVHRVACWGRGVDRLEQGSR